MYRVPSHQFSALCLGLLHIWADVWGGLRGFRGPGPTGGRPLPLVRQSFLVREASHACEVARLTHTVQRPQVGG